MNQHLSKYMKDYLFDFKKSLLVAHNQFLQDNWDDFIKEFPTATMSSTNVGEFLEFMKREQERYLEEIKQDVI